MSSNKETHMIEYTVQVEEDVTIWLLNGKRHREDGHAMEHADGSKEWYINGKRHREDGPAIEYNNGDKEWFLNGKRHREDGPAIEYNNGTVVYYLNGIELTEVEFNNRNKKELSVADIEQLLGYSIKIVK